MLDIYQIKGEKGTGIADTATEVSGSTARLNEQLHYAFDPTGNLAYRTNNALIEKFQVNSVNELTSNTNGGTLTVVGTTTTSASRDRHGDWGRDVAMLLGRNEGGLRLRELGKAAGVGEAGVSMAVKRAKARAETEPALALALRQCQNKLQM